MLKTFPEIIIPARVYNNTFYQGNKDQINPVAMLPIKVWCQQNFFTIRQAKILIRKCYLIARTRKGRLYVAVNPKPID